MSYPNTLDNLPSDMVGTTSVTDAVDGHSLMHRKIGSATNAIQTVLGTTLGTSVLKNFAAGDFASRINTGGTLQQIITGGTLNNVLLGSPSINGRLLTNSGLDWILQTSTGGAVNAINVANAATGNAPKVSATGSDTNVNLELGAQGTSGVVKTDNALVPTIVTLTDSAGGTISTNAALGQIFDLALGTTAGNRTIGTPSNAIDGQNITYRVKQNTNNTGTIIWSSIFRQNGNGTIALGTQSTLNYYSYRYNATDTKWDSQGNSTGII